MNIKDIKIAQKLVDGTYNNYDKNMFHNYSFVYKKSNEQISKYQYLLENREKILSVIASSDQILNCILEGTKHIDAFDVSVFPKYFLYLKLAAIESLTNDQYIDFFYGYFDRSEEEAEYHDDIYTYLIRNNLEKDAKKFWDNLFNQRDWYEIYNSNLFSSESVIKNHVIEENKYLDENEFNKLKSLIRNININTYDGDILELIDKFKSSYDLVYLSNIWLYFNHLPDYKKLLNKLNLTDNGIALTYLHHLDDNARNYFNEDNYLVKQFENDNSGVLIYKK